MSLREIWRVDEECDLRLPENAMQTQHCVTTKKTKTLAVCLRKRPVWPSVAEKGRLVGGRCQPPEARCLSGGLGQPCGGVKASVPSLGTK